MKDGIYILANDVVFDQLVALLNSIEANISPEIPVCIIPYNDRLEKVRSEIATRPQVSLFENTASLQKWEAFATQVWKSHVRAQKVWRERQLPEVYRIEMHRKLCCFDGEFDRFVYFDADTLAFGSIDSVFQKLDTYDWVSNDYQYSSDIKYIFDAPETELMKVFDAETLKADIFCAGWFASKKNVFTDEILRSLLTSLQTGESNLLALWGTDQSLMNYMVLRSQIAYYNFAITGTAPGSHWSSSFEQHDHVLYDKGQPLTYLHYMSIPSFAFTRLCQGEDVSIPYRDLFLHYRYLKAPQDRPKEFKSPDRFTQARSLITKFRRQKISNLNHRFRKLKLQLNKMRG
ncbi:sugar transferase [Cyanobacteria bacterium FACHB-DQ100]|nr:sugar transferase [Cyanobacteria bacterium FACHB-DQ100]